jgi:hypothetical protein
MISYSLFFDLCFSYSLLHSKFYKGGEAKGIPDIAIGGPAIRQLASPVVS